MLRRVYQKLFDFQEGNLQYSPSQTRSDLKWSNVELISVCGWKRGAGSFFLSSICHQQINTACVLLPCDTWAAVGGRCSVFIHSLVSSQTGTEFHYSGIKQNQFCPLRTLSLWVLVKCKECWPCISSFSISLFFFCTSLQWLYEYGFITTGSVKMLLKYSESFKSKHVNHVSKCLILYLCQKRFSFNRWPRAVDAGSSKINSTSRLITIWRP